MVYRRRRGLPSPAIILEKRSTRSRPLSAPSASSSTWPLFPDNAMFDLSDLYQEVILDHNKRPRNFQVLEGANRQAEGYNPLCGDQLTLYLLMDGDVIRDISFQGSGCAISKASASL